MLIPSELFCCSSEIICHLW